MWVKRRKRKGNMYLNEMIIRKECEWKWINVNENKESNECEWK